MKIEVIVSTLQLHIAWAALIKTSRPRTIDKSATANPFLRLFVCFQRRRIIFQAFADCCVQLAGVVCVTPAPGLRLWRRLECDDSGSTVSRTRNKSKRTAAQEIFRNNAIKIYIHECCCNSLGGARLTERCVARQAHTHTHVFSTQYSQRPSAKATPHREDDICHCNMPGRAALARVAISWMKMMRRKRRVKTLIQLL